MKSWRGRFGALVAALALCAPGFGIASYGHASAAPTSEPSRRVFASSVCAPPHCAFHGSTQSLSFGATSREYFGSSLVAANGGYWLAASNGRVFNFGDAQTYGSLAGRDAYFGDVVAMAATPDGKGYWLAASNGRVFNFGDAQSYGSGESSALRPHGTRIVGIAVTPDGKGYWLAASNGRVFNFGDAQTYGSLAGRDAYFGDVVAMAATPDGKGYWLAASNGRVFNFGDAQSYGSGESSALRPHGTRIVGIAVTPDGKGYWLASANAAVATYGDASSYGLGTRPGLSKSVVSIAATPGGSGYWLAATDGAVFNLSGAPFDGSVPGMGARVGGIVAIVPAVGRLPITPPTTTTSTTVPPTTTTSTTVPPTTTTSTTVPPTTTTSTTVPPTTTTSTTVPPTTTTSTTVPPTTTTSTTVPPTTTTSTTVPPTTTTSTTAPPTTTTSTTAPPTTTTSTTVPPTTTTSTTAPPGIGSLSITITNLPADTNAAVQVVAPDGTSQLITAGTTITSAASGQWVVTANQVPVGSLTYYPTVQTTDVELAVGAQGSVEIDYDDVVNDSTLVVTPSAVSSVSPPDANGDLTVTIADPAQLISAGSVLAIGVGPETPEGLLLDVISVTSSGGIDTAVATEGSLTDIGPQADIVADQSYDDTGNPVSDSIMVPSTSESSSVQGNTERSELMADDDSGGQPINDKGLKCDGGVTGSINGSIDLTPHIHLEVQWGGILHPGTITAEAYLQAVETAELDAMVEGSASCSLDINLLPEPIIFTPIDIQVGPVPVVIVPKLNFELVGTASVDGEVESSVTQTLKATVGVKWDGGSLSPIVAGPTNTITFQPPTPSLTGSLYAQVGPKLSFDVEDIAGPFITADVHTDLALNAAKSPWWDLTAGIEAGGGLEFHVFGIDFQVADPHILSYTWDIAHATVSAPLTITTPPLAGATQYDAYDKTLAAVGGTSPYTWSVTSGALPDGLTLDPATGELSGTPDVIASNNTFTVTVTDQDGVTAQKSYDIAVSNHVLDIATLVLPDAIYGYPYDETLQAIGGEAPYNWAITSGVLPDGLSFDGSSGTISGVPTPTAVGGTVTFQVKDQKGASWSETLALVITNPTGGSISGTVNDTAGDPVQGVQVDVDSYSGGYAYTAVTATDGTYTVTGVAQGFHTVCFAAPDTGGLAESFVDQCYKGVPWDGTSNEAESGARLVGVTEGSTTTGIGASLTPGGSISGNVIAAQDGALLTGISVSAYAVEGTDDNVVSFGNAVTDNNGDYMINGLPTGSYYVCYSTTGASGGSSATGYIGECYSGAPWYMDPQDIPNSGATTVAVATGSTTTDIDAALVPGGEITGTVTGSSSDPLAGVEVVAYGINSSFTTATVTGADGSYTLRGLPTGTAGWEYDVCFDASGVTTGSSTGYAAQCYNDVPWDAYYVPRGYPPAANSSNYTLVTPGAITPDIDAALAPAGVISGAVVFGSTGALSGVTVDVFDSNGYFEGSTITAADGSYQIIGLGTGSYAVCFESRSELGTDYSTGSVGQCTGDVSWDGSHNSEGEPPSPPENVTDVQVTDGSTTIANGLTGGTISGTVTDTSSEPLQDVTVDAFTNTGAFEGSAITGASGYYSLIGVPPGQYDICFDVSGTTGGSSTTGYVSACYTSAPWYGASNLSGPPSGSGAVAVAVTDGSTETADMAITPGGEISGTVTDGSSGPLQGVAVDVVSTDGSRSPQVPVSTSAIGTYVITDLPAGGYAVCFGASYINGGSSTTGYLDQCYSGIPWDGSAAGIAGGTSVAVTAGATTSQVDATLSPAAAISGTVTDLSSAPLQNSGVYVYDASGDRVGWADTAADGTYTVVGLTAGTYRVCFDTSDASAVSTGAYVDQCYADVVWGDGEPFGDVEFAPSVPAAAAGVSVVAGSTTAGVSAQLSVFGTITGKVTDTTSEPLTDVVIDVVAASGTGSFSTGATDPDGEYTASYLLPGSYDVCFDTTGATGGESSDGYLDECYSGAPWDGELADVTGATPVTITSGLTVPGIDEALAPAGSVTGTVTDSSSSPLADVVVDAFTPGGVVAGSATTTADGTYVVRRLVAGEYNICFDASKLDNSNSTGGYEDQCHDGVYWDGSNFDVDGATVAVVGGSTVTGIDAALVPFGAISGVVTDSVGVPVDNVRVDVFTTGATPAFVASTSTAVDGSYTVLQLRAGDYYLCFDTSNAEGGTGVAGYADQCYNAAAWDGSFGDPAQGEQVQVQSGALTSVLNTALGAYWAVSGTVTDTSSNPLKNVRVDVTAGNGSFATSTTTASDGTYTVKGLQDGEYYVCFVGTTVTGGVSGTGYLDQCSGGAPWDGAGLTGVAPVTVTTGSVTTVDAIMATGGAVSGTVTDSAGSPVEGVGVYVYTTGTPQVEVGSTVTVANGSYGVTGLSPGNYYVCFDGSSVTGGSAKEGYLDQCYQDVPWTFDNAGLGAVVAATTGSMTTGIDAIMSVAGGISGTVKDSSSDPLEGVYVQVFGVSAGSLSAYSRAVVTGTDGTYSITGLPTGSYDVCFSASGATGGGSSSGYAAQCFQGVPWDGYVADINGATPVPVSVGSMVSHTDATLNSPGEISGNVTDSFSDPLQDVTVEVYTASGVPLEAGYSLTGADGSFTVTGLLAGNYYVCFDGSDATGGSFTEYLDQCYQGASWDGYPNRLKWGDHSDCLSWRGD